MTRISKVFLLLIFVVAVVPPLEARPEFLIRFQADPFRNADVDGCGTCHVSSAGGGVRNEFGQAFAANEFSVTPMMRAQFPDRFDLNTNEIADGVLVYFSDPEGRSVVVDVGGEKHLVEIPGAGPLETAAAESPASETPARESSFSFFVTSSGPGKGGNLGGLAGADRHCQMLAETAGANSKTWRAYLSTTLDGQPAINAGDRIGSGPWYNVNRLLVARGIAELHSESSRLNEQTAFSEKGEMIDGNRHDILTGSLPDGTAAPNMQCENWTSSGEGSATLGHFDREGGGDNGTSWNSAHASRSCSQEDLRGTGGDGLFYCFAID